VSKLSTNETDVTKDDNDVMMIKSSLLD